MVIAKLVSGIALLIVFGWILLRNKERKGVIHSLFRIDTLVGIVAGIYLILTSVISIWG